MQLESWLKFGILAALPLVAGPAFSASQTATFQVTATVSQSCTISATALSFGAYDPLGANATSPLTGTGTVTVACTKGATGLTVGMDNGLHVSGTQRQMLGAVNGNSLQYNLIQPPNNTPGTACTFSGTAWDNTVAGLLTLTSPASKAGRTYNVCGSIPAAQDVFVDSYSDTVTATINF